MVTGFELGFEMDMLEVEKRKVELMKELLDTFKNIDKSLKKISELVSYNEEDNEPCIKIYDSSRGKGQK